MSEVRTIIETNRKPFVILDSKYNVLITNQKFFKTFDVSSEQVLGSNFYSIDNGDWDIEGLHALIEINLPGGTALDDFEIDHTFKRLGRKILRINAQSYYHAKIGEQLTLLSIEDFTKRKLLEEQLKESEERFRRMFETSRDGLMLVNKISGNIKYSNQSIADMLGVVPDEIVEKSFFDIGIWDKGIDFPEMLKALDVNGFLKRQAKLLNIRTNREFDAEIFLIDRAALLQCNVRDITERVKTEEAHHTLQKQLLQAQRLESIGRLAGGIAHDFNNMLSIIMGHSELMIDELRMDHPHRVVLEEVIKATSRARDLTRQLLAFGRKQVLEIKKEDINDIIAGFEKLIRRVIGEDIELKISLLSKEVVVEVDTTHIEQVLMNLAVNARDAMPEGGQFSIETGIVNLDASYTDRHPGVSPGSYAMIAVSDTGIGMDPETLTQIFEPFFTTKGKDKGTGLGLATCYGIVKQHGGNIWVYSEPGHGTTFKIYLPLATGSAKISRQQPFDDETVGGGETVLVIEDDESVRKLTCKMLMRFGYRVIESKNVTDAIERAHNREPSIDLVLTDVVMPGLKGPEVFQRICEHHPTAKVLYMSGYADDVIVHKGILDDGVQFLQKPFSLHSLLKKVKETLHKSFKGN